MQVKMIIIYTGQINILRCDKEDKQTLMLDLNLSFAKTLECSAVQRMASSVHCQILNWTPTTERT